MNNQLFNDMYKEVNEGINNIEENVNVIEGNVVGQGSINLSVDI